MLISEAQERKRYICYCHKHIVQRWTTPSSSWRWWRCLWRRRPLRQGSAGVSPSDLQPPGLCFWFLLCGGPPVEKHQGTSYIGVLGHEDASGRRIDANGATRAEIGGPTRPGTVAAWDPPFWSSGLHSLTSFAPKSSPSKIMIP